MTRATDEIAPSRGLLTPNQFAHRVDSTVSELKRYHREGRFLAFQPGGDGRGKRRLYAPRQIEEFFQMFSRVVVKKTDEEVLRKQIQISETQRLHHVPFTAEQSRIAFIAFDEGHSATYLVTQRDFHPDVARATFVAWSEMSERLVVRKEIVELINRLPLTGPIPMRSDSDLLEVLTIASSENACGACKKRPRCFCKMCVASVIKEARREEQERLKALVESGQAIDVEAPLYVAPPEPPPAKRRYKKRAARRSVAEAP